MQVGPVGEEEVRAALHVVSRRAPPLVEHPPARHAGVEVVGELELVHVVALLRDLEDHVTQRDAARLGEHGAAQRAVERLGRVDALEV